MQRLAGVTGVVGVVVALQATTVRPREVTVAATSSGVQLVAQQTVPAAPLEAIPEPFRYTAKGRRDPFTPLVIERPVGEGILEPVQDQTRPRGPLERFALATLQLRGILWGKFGRHAIIRAPDGKGYFVTVGMYLGRNGGQIVAIEDDHLVLKEQFKNIEGNIIDKTLTVPLRRKKTDRN
ncbi:hypothetical protein NKDENANG_03142 [Candidatus Entotheonellaceae bacterium PAL068K]